MSNRPVLGYRMLILTIVRPSTFLHDMCFAVAHYDAADLDQWFARRPDLVAEFCPGGTRRLQTLPIHHINPLAVVSLGQTAEAEARLYLDPVVDLLVGLEPVGGSLALSQAEAHQFYRVGHVLLLIGYVENLDRRNLRPCC